jgi:hypothetical protein
MQCRRQNQQKGNGQLVLPTGNLILTTAEGILALFSCLDDL